VVRASGDGSRGGEVAAAGVPTLQKDPYSAEFLIDPYPFHEVLREAGPVVWLEAYDVWAAGRVEPAGEPRRHVGDSIRSFESLLVTFRPRSSLAWRVDAQPHSRGGTGKGCAHR
jgi:hypothetical protein